MADRQIDEFDIITWPMAEDQQAVLDRLEKERDADELTEWESFFERNVIQINTLYAMRKFGLYYKNAKSFAESMEWRLKEDTWFPNYIYSEPKHRLPVMALMVTGEDYEDDISCDDDETEELRDNNGRLVPICGQVYDGGHELCITPLWSKPSGDCTFISFSRAVKWRYLTLPEAAETWVKRFNEIMEKEKKDDKH